MSTREKILEAVLMNQPAATDLPNISMIGGDDHDLVQNYMDVFKSIGGNSFLANDFVAVKEMIRKNFDPAKRIVTTLPELGDPIEQISGAADPHSYEDVELAIIRAHFAVAENGAVWLTEDLMGQRIIPYICQHLAVVVDAHSLVPTLHEAYEKIGAGDYGFGAFIGGPSKTADIEQALVLGAHGPLSMTVFILK
ncbi:MAG: lactate utilization protein C [Chitinophagales bacterium]